MLQKNPKAIDILHQKGNFNWSCIRKLEYKLFHAKSTKFVKIEL